MEPASSFPAGLGYPVDCPSPEDGIEMGTTKVVWRLGTDPDWDTHTFAHALIYCWMALAQQGTFGDFTYVKNIIRLGYEADPSRLETIIDFPRYGDDFYATLTPLLAAIDGWSRRNDIPIISCSMAGDAYLWPDQNHSYDDWVDGNLWPYDIDTYKAAEDSTRGRRQERGLTRRWSAVPQ